MRTLFRALSLVALAATALAAKADTLDFTIAGEGNIYTFSLPSMVVPVDYDGNGVSFNTFAVVTENGLASPAPDQLTFYNDRLFAGLIIDSGSSVELDLVSFPLFSGSPGSPTLLTGVFPAENIVDEAPYTITAEPESTTPVPEPSGAVLLATGILALTGAARRRLLAR